MHKNDKEQGDASRAKDRRVTLEDVPSRILSPSSIPMTHNGVCAKVDENSPRVKRRISHAGHAGVSPLAPPCYISRSPSPSECQNISDEAESCGTKSSATSSAGGKAAGCSEAEDVQEYALAFDTGAVQGDKGLFDILEVRLCDVVSRAARSVKPWVYV